MRSSMSLNNARLFINQSRILLKQLANLGWAEYCKRELARELVVVGVWREIEEEEASSLFILV